MGTFNQILAPVSIGELIYKVTILRIKCEKIKDKKKCDNAKNELESLLRVCQESEIDLENELVDRLYNCNQKLWDIEDKIRLKEKSKEFDDEFVQIARSVYFSNDDRFQIKRKLNTKYGSQIVEEKSYQEYS